MSRELKRLALSACVLALTPVAAQSLRDPTIPPASVPPSESGERSAKSDIKGPLSVVVVNGQPHLVVGTRLYAQGRTLGRTRIERITETEVWLREGRELRKIPRFSGIQRRSTASADVVPVCAGGDATASKPSRPARSPPPGPACDKSQP